MFWVQCIIHLYGMFNAQNTVVLVFCIIVGVVVGGGVGTTFIRAF